MRSGVAGPGPHSNFKNQFSVKARTNPGGFSHFLPCSELAENTLFIGSRPIALRMAAISFSRAVATALHLLCGRSDFFSVSIFSTVSGMGSIPRTPPLSAACLSLGPDADGAVIFSLNMARVLSKGPHVGRALERSLDVDLDLLRAAFAAPSYHR